MGNKSALVQIVAWRRTGDKSLAEPMLTKLLLPGWPGLILPSWLLLNSLFKKRHILKKKINKIQTTWTPLSHQPSMTSKYGDVISSPCSQESSRVITVIHEPHVSNKSLEPVPDYTVIQIKYGLPYCVTCPSLSMDPGSLNPSTRRSQVPGWWDPGIGMNTGAGDTVLTKHT